SRRAARGSAGNILSDLSNFFAAQAKSETDAGLVCIFIGRQAGAHLEVRGVRADCPAAPLPSAAPANPVSALVTDVQVKSPELVEKKSGCDADEQRLMNFLLQGYELSVRPVFNSSEAVTAQMGITLTQIFDMDEKNQQWSDEFLTWDPAEFSNQKKIRLPSGKIWKPDLRCRLHRQPDARLAMIDSNGTVFWPIPTKLRSSCKVDVTYFPFDEQMCDLKFGSWTYDGFQVNLHLLKGDVDTTAYVPNGGSGSCSELKLEPYPDITFYIFLRRKRKSRRVGRVRETDSQPELRVFRIDWRAAKSEERPRRRLLYYMYHVIYPCIMMSTLTLLVFCLPPDSGEKIALGITVLLAFSVLMLSIADRLPETSESVPLI
uniref:Neur_chan_LBD domain-containing protein n=1 Tax=Macrostomum lignano TaxID=282301 RepID=A0A1I8FT32_9PLAT